MPARVAAAALIAALFLGGCLFQGDVRRDDDDASPPEADDDDSSPQDDDDTTPGPDEDDSTSGDDDDSTPQPDDDDTTPQPDDDDTTPQPDDDDTTPQPDDDDTTPQPDDDDSAPQDDDDSAPPDDDDTLPPDDDDATTDPGFIDETYCLDWNQATISSPPSLVSMLAMIGVDLADWPLLLTPTGIDEAAGHIWMLSGSPFEGTCSQDTTASTSDLTAANPGTWSDPSFDVGPSQVDLLAGTYSIPLYGAVFTGQFTPDASQVVGGTIEAEANVTQMNSACLFLPCFTCSTGVGDCLDLSVQNAVYDATGAGPLIAVP